MLSMLAKRVLQLIPLLLGLTLIVFLLLQALPGDPARTQLGLRATPQAIAELHTEWGLDEPLPVQYVQFVARTAQLDLGTSITRDVPVTSLIEQSIGPTLALIGMTVLIALVVAIPLAVAGAVRQGSAIDWIGRVGPVVAMGLPAFWVGLMLLQVFALQLKMFPAGGYQSGFFGALQSLLLPSIALSLALVPLLLRSLRSSLADVLSSDFVTFLRSRGVQPWRIIWLHGLRNALIPAVSVLGVYIGFLVGATVVIERAFALPGLGNLALTAIAQRDFPVVLGVTLAFGVLVVAVNLIVDLTYSLLDPNFRAGQRGA